MNFISWHIKIAIPFMLGVLANLMIFVDHYFSLGRLLSSLGQPWKRQVATDEDRINWLARSWFDLLSRVIGAVVRSSVIIAGLVVGAWVALLGIVVIGALAIVPLPLVPFYFKWRKERGGWNRDQSRDELVKQVWQSEFMNFVVSRCGLEIESMKRISGEIDFNKVEWLTKAHEYKQEIESDETGEVEMGLAWLSHEAFSQILREKRIESEDLLRLAKWYLKLKLVEYKRWAFWSKGYLLSIEGVGKGWQYGFTPRLDEYAREVRLSDYKEVVFEGRRKDIQRLVRALSREDIKHVLIYGPVGIGRHTLLGGLVQKIAWHEIEELKHKRVLVLDTEKLLAHPEKRSLPDLVKSLMNEAEAAGNVILVIDKLDELIGEDEALARTLEETLSQDHLQMIAITTEKGFYETIENKLDTEKLFTHLLLAPLSREETMLVVFELAVEAERNRNVYWMYPALKKVVDLTERYFPDQTHPEKDIRLMKDVESFCVNKGKKKIEVSIVEEMVAEISGVPNNQMGEDTKKELLHIEDKLAEGVIEQDEAITKIAKALRRSVSRVGSHERPIGSFLLLGPTGVGKTQTAKVLARVFFGEEKMIRLDMAEFAVSDGLARLIGFPEQGMAGRLSQKLEEQPYGVLLLDEFEKANKEVLNLFLSILDEGVFTNAWGKAINCRNLLIVATSNALSQEISELSQSEDIEENEAKLRRKLVKEGWFTAELLNRFDGVIFYKPLTPSGLARVTTLMLTELAGRLAKQGVSVSFEEDLVGRIINEGYQAEFGARSIRRFIADTIEDEIAKILIEDPETKELRI